MVALVLLDVPGGPSPSPSGVYPAQSNGLAAYLVGGFFGLGLLILVMVLLNRRPRRGRPSSTRND